MSDNDELMTIDQVAELFGVTKKCLYKWRYERRGPAAAKIGRELRYRRTDVQAYLDDLFAKAGHR